MQTKSTDPEAFGQVIGPENVSTDKTDLESYRSAGLSSRGEPAAVVRPHGMEQLRDVILMARETGANLVFSSSYPPRFRGDSIPGGEGVIVDLTSMDKILRIDRRNKVAYIEPGVTFETLIEQVDRSGMKLPMPLLPRKGKSVLSCFLEREPITIPKYHWDMTDPLLCTEMVFGSGDLFRTGTAGSPGSIDLQIKSGLAHKNPLGPGATDFLRIVQGSQGTLAGVTWATIKLEVKPTVHKIYFACDDRLERLVEFTYRALRPRLGDEWLILGARALATAIGESPESIDDLARRQAPWTLAYGVSGYRYYPEERLALQENELARIAQAVGVRPVPEVPGCPAKKMEGILAGPSPDPYYKIVSRGAFADIAFLATLDKAGSMVEVMSAACDARGYPPSELGIYIQPIRQGRAAHVEFTVYYDPADEADCTRARDLVEAASVQLDEAGAFFSRPYGNLSRIAFRNCPDTVEALRKVKQVMDPDNVLNRGKLCFGEEVV
jgi:FAD binding domain/FAD linked oxidases, C-terminal domain